MPRKRTVLDTQPDGIFNGLEILVFPALIASKRLTLFESQIRKVGGKWITLCDLKSGRKPSHVIVDGTLAKDSAKVRRLLQEANIELTTDVITTMWLSDCLKRGALEPKDNYLICDADNSLVSESVASGEIRSSGESGVKSCQKSDLTCISDADEPTAASSSTEDSVSPKRSKVDVGSSLTSANDVIIAELQKLADAFTSKGDTWRSHGYNKAISAIRRHGFPINSYEEAEKIPGVGKRIAEKVWEILECGSLRKVAEVCGDEKTKIVELFTGVWGAGPSTAESWYKQGYRSLADLKQNASLTKQQQVGLKHYDDFADRMSREEVERIGALVKEMALAVEPSVEVILVGSYRRGKSTCGDVDVLICRPDHIKPGSILPRLLDALKEKNFITDDLVHIEEQKNQRKYLGVCRLPGENQKHRRLDIFVAPRSEMAAALMHYTGSALFNRSIRLDAAKKGMSLSEHCLATDVIRQGSTIISEGRVIPTLTEAAIFEELRMKYLEPSERNY